MVRVQAHAKLNLSLEIVGKRPDGFHELVSVMQLVELADELRMEHADDIQVRSSEQSLNGPDNLVYRAARALHTRFQVSSGCHIELIKHIPSAAGLGGGSSDAAATLIALCTLWELRPDCEELVQLAAELGSDVPYFLYGGTALVTGRGERVTRLREPESLWYLLVNPGFAAPTRDVFGELRSDEWTDGQCTRRLACDVSEHGVTRIGVNGLASALFRLQPEAQPCFERVRLLAPGSTFLSGSGPTVAAQFSTREAARHAEHMLRDSGYWTTITRTLAAPAGTMPCL